MKVKTKINYDKLKDLVKDMSKKYSVKVGLLANKGGSEQIAENLDYAGLGAVQEFGADIKITEKMAAYLAITAKELGLEKIEKHSDGYLHIPARSFLRMPLSRGKGIIKRLKKHMAVTSQEDITYYFATTGDMMSLAVILGASAVEQINEAFDTNGFGKWAPNSPYTIAAKGSNKPLLDTGELRRKITYEIEQK